VVRIDRYEFKTRRLSGLVCSGQKFNHFGSSNQSQPILPLTPPLPALP
jgi:hypothetical protein